LVLPGIASVTIATKASRPQGKSRSSQTATRSAVTARDPGAAAPTGNHLVGPALVPRQEPHPRVVASPDLIGHDPILALP